MPTVLLVDDEIQPMKYYVMALEAEGFEVDRVLNPDEAIDYIARKPRPDVVILDLMMRPGKRYAGNTACGDGLRTGLLVYPDLRRHCAGVPCVVLTNLKDPRTLRDFEQLAPGVPIFEKLDTPPVELARQIRELMG